MNTKMKSESVFLLILFLLEAICSQGCWKHEREALLGLSAHLDIPSTWIDGTDCCQWERVECHTATGRVAKLDLSHMWVNWPENWYLSYTDFLVFEDLKSLNLAWNDINGCVGNEGLRLSNLEVLDLSNNSPYSSSNGSILSCLDELSSLRSLDLSFNGLNETTSYHAFEALSSKLLNLEVLDVSNNYWTNDFLPSLRGFKSLKNLTLSYNGLNSERNIQEKEEFAWPANLQVLQLGGNRFSKEFLSSLSDSLSALQYLKSLDLSHNQLEGSLNISGLLALSNLEKLDLSYNNISNFVVHQGSKSQSKLDVLALEENMMNGQELRTSLQAFSSIRMLSLRNNKFKGTVVAGDFRDLSNLEHLALDGSSIIANEFFKSIGELTSLKVLSLFSCGINGILPTADWSKLKKLEELDLSDNELGGPLPSSFVNMTSLRKLDLSHNHFTGNFGPNLGSLTSLEYFGFTENRFQVPLSFTPFANHSKLKFIYGDGNRVILDSYPSLQSWVPKFQLQVLSLSSTTDTDFLPLPKFLLYQYNLTSLDFTSCKLEGEFPNWLLENNTKIEELVLGNCSFKGTFQLPSRPLASLEKIDVSNNAITGQFPNNNISSIFPNLQDLDMSKNAIHGSIPREFGQMNLLVTLDLSDNYLSGEIPMNISGVGSQPIFLKLSNNKLDGPLFPSLSTLKYVGDLYLDGNRLSGSIPSSFFNTSLTVLDISNNFLVGKLPSWAGNSSFLEDLYISNNNLEGSIPAKFVEQPFLTHLDISRNKLTGSVPSFINSSVRFIHLSNNRLSGLAKRMFSKSSPLVALDLNYNEITSSIDNLMQDLHYTWLNILLLKGNHFTGHIPKQLCQLKDIMILDLSYNNFNGPIPSCLGKIPFESSVEDGFVACPIFKNYRSCLPHVGIPQETADFITKSRFDTYKGDILAYMTGIDLSFNKLNGNIPSELGNLTKIRGLNLSHNCLTGQIPATFSNLILVESLDLSFNKLSGQIPPQLTGLTFLEVFIVAHNNLSGATPDRKGQFITFDASSYEGNPFLCGPPLQEGCNAPAILPSGSYNDGDNGSLVDMYVFWVSFVVSYASVVLVIAAILYINPYWRRAWFCYIELVSVNCYYFIEDNLQKISNAGNV